VIKIAYGEKTSKLGSIAAASRHINAMHTAAFVPNKTYEFVCYDVIISLRAIIKAIFIIDTYTHATDTQTH